LITKNIYFDKIISINNIILIISNSFFPLLKKINNNYKPNWKKYYIFIIFSLYIKPRLLKEITKKILFNLVFYKIYNIFIKIYNKTLVNINSFIIILYYFQRNLNTKFLYFIKKE